MFEVGSIVLLRSGGKSMVVTEKRRDGAIRCAWHDDDGRPCDKQYPEDCLMLEAGE